MKGERHMVLYVAVTNDRYELPIAVAETQTELAIIVGVDKSTICRQIKRRAAGEKERPRKKMRNEILQG